MRLLFFFACISSLLFAENQLTTHTLTLPDQTLSYTATTGTLPTRNKKGETIGEIGYTAYISTDSSTKRPLTFVFNGGPGSSSIWLHMGTFGPYRVKSPQDGASLVPPYEWGENPETILDLTDLVFIDPMGTGWSQARSLDDAKICYGMQGDIRSIGDFIRDYLTENKRWNSPKYLAGESYGTLRALGLSEYLMDSHSIYLNGLILISCALDYQPFIFQEDNWLPYLCFLPTYATTAWHYGRYRPEATLEEVAQEARTFAYETLLPFLILPRSFNEEQKEVLYTQIAAFTGLTQETVRRYQGRISEDCFFKEFFGEQNRLLGRFDTQSVADTLPSYDLPFYLDPSATCINGPFAAAFQDYLQTKLQTDHNYKVFSYEAYHHWNLKDSSSWGYPNMLNALRKSMLANPALKVYVGCGYYDAATPFLAAEYNFDQLSLPAHSYSQFQFHYYEGGHMYYLEEKVRQKFKKDLTRFYE